MLFLTAILFLSGYNILPVDFSGLPLDLSEDSSKLRTDAWLFAVEDDEVTALSGGGQLERGTQYQPIHLVYEGDNVFTRENLLSIKENEDELFKNSDYQNKLCLMQGVANRTCTKPLSILRFFDGTYKLINSTFYDPNFENIAGVIYAARMHNKSNAILNFHLSKDAKISRTEVSSPHTRSLLYTGWPLKGYDNYFDSKDEQIEKIDERIVQIFAETFSEKYKDGVGALKFFYYSLPLWTDDLKRQVVYDMMLAVASFIFIFLFMWFQTGSLWITSWGVFSILSSFNITNLLYRVVLDYRYIGIFHVLSIFIILGIGSDNIFVFMDTWKQSAGYKYKSLAHRLSDVYRSVAKTTFVTSITTLAAFLSNATSPLLAVSSFGIFSSMLIFVNYLSVVIFFPAVVIMHHFTRKGRCCCCTLCCCNTTHVSNADDLIDGEDIRETSRKRKTVLEYVIQFFDGWFFRNVVTHRFVRWVVLVVSVAIMAVAIAFATQLQAANEQAKVWRGDTNWAKFDILNNNAFVKSQEDDVLVVNIIWGLKEQDRSECHHTDYKCKGKTVFDRSFDLNPPPCQMAMLDFCKELKSLSPAQEKSLKLRRNEVTGDIETECVFERMDEYLKKEAEKARYPNDSDFSIVINSNKMETMMEHNPKLYNISLLPDTYYRYFEIGLGYFITNGGRKNYASTYDFKKYERLLGGVADPTLAKNASESTALQGNEYGHRLAYVGIAVNTTLNPRTLGYEVGLPVYEEWEKFVSNRMSEFPSSCNNAFQATVRFFNIWHWIKVQRVLALNAMTGILIGISLALVILVLATTNVIVGLLATFVIGLISCTVLGVITIIGWTLGPLESLNLTLVVGLAVDYVVHLAEGYMVLSHETRSNKVRYSLSHVGVSVLSGACSTLGASIFMLAARILFFVQFGLFIFCTIGFSILYSLFLFPTLMALLGPQGSTGSILPVGRMIRNVFRGQKNEHTDCAFCEGKGYYEKGKYGEHPLKETQL